MAIILGQILTVPFFLSKWSASEYGAFLLAQAFVSVLNTLDVGHQNYLGYRFIATRSRRRVSLEVFSAIPYTLLMGVFQLAIAITVSQFNIFHLTGTTVSGRSLESATSTAILLLSLTWIVSGGVGGIFGRSVAPYGHLPRLAWWNVLNAALQALAPVLACLLGADVYIATLSLCSVTIIYNALLYFDIAGLWRREGLKPTRPDLKIGAINAWNALALVAREFFLQFRQQGVRTLLAPVAGTEALASFTITRTGANVALQGLSTLTTPLEPEVLRFAHQREDIKLYSILSILTTIIVIAINIPTIPLQFFAPYIFSAWTNNKISFDPVLFALLSSTVTFFAISQPGLIIVRGNNLLRSQIVITIISSAITLGGIFTLSPLFGLRGAAFSLLAAEAYSAIHIIYLARRWMIENKLTFPTLILTIGTASVITTLVTTQIMALQLVPMSAALGVGIAVQCAMACTLIRHLPAEARDRIFLAIKLRWSQVR